MSPKFKDWHIWGVSSAADRVRAMVSGLPGNKSRLRNLMVLQAFIDDSKDGKKERVFALGGFIASAEAWAKFSLEWEAHLKDCRLPYFKYSEICQTHKSRPEIIASFYRIIENHDISLSIDCVLDLNAWDRVMLDLQWPEELHHFQKITSNPYYLVSKKIMHGIFHWAEKLHLQEPIDLIFDEQLSEKNVVWEAWSYFKHTMPEAERKRMGDLPSFKSDLNIMPLQAADLIAGCSRQSAEKGNRTKIYPWAVKKEIGKITITLKEEAIREEFSWIFSKESFENALSFVRQEKLVKKAL